MKTGARSREAILCHGEGFPLRDPDRAYYMVAQTDDVEGLVSTTGLVLDPVWRNEPWVLAICRLGTWPSAADGEWWVNSVREVLGDAWSPGSDGYADDLAETAARLFTRSEADQLSAWVDETLGDFLTCTLQRVITLTEFVPVPVPGGHWVRFDRWRSYSFPFRSGGRPLRRKKDSA